MLTKTQKVNSIADGCAQYIKSHWADFKSCGVNNQDQKVLVLINDFSCPSSPNLKSSLLFFITLNKQLLCNFDENKSSIFKPAHDKYVDIFKFYRASGEKIGDTSNQQGVALLNIKIGSYDLTIGEITHPVLDGNFATAYCGNTYLSGSNGEILPEL